MIVTENDITCKSFNRRLEDQLRIDERAGYTTPADHFLTDHLITPIQHQYPKLFMIEILQARLQIQVNILAAIDLVMITQLRSLTTTTQFQRCSDRDSFCFTYPFEFHKIAYGHSAEFH